MNIVARNKLMAVLTEISQWTPQIRLGQLLSLLLDHVDHAYGDDVIFEIEDDELLDGAKAYLQELRSKPKEDLLERVDAYRQCDLVAAASA